MTLVRKDLPPIFACIYLGWTRKTSDRQVVINLLFYFNYFIYFIYFIDVGAGGQVSQ